MRSAMDAGRAAGDEAVMILAKDYSDEARALWGTALDLNRVAAAVSPAAGRLPPLLFFTDPERTPRPWETAARLPAGAAVVFRAFGRADALVLGYLKEIYSGSMDPIKAMAMRDLYDLLEKVIDRCRDACNVTSQIVLKNS